MPRLVGTATRYACNCVVTDTGWLPRDTDPNGNVRDLDRAALRTAIARVSGPRDTDESQRVVETLKAAKARGVRAADFDKMVTAKRPEKDEQGKDVMVWSAAPGRCELHDAPVVLSATYDYIAPDPEPDVLAEVVRGRP